MIVCYSNNIQIQPMTLYGRILQVLKNKKVAIGMVVSHYHLKDACRRLHWYGFIRDFLLGRRKNQPCEAHCWGVWGCGGVCFFLLLLFFSTRVLPTRSWNSTSCLYKLAPQDHSFTPPPKDVVMNTSSF